MTDRFGFSQSVQGTTGCVSVDVLESSEMHVIEGCRSHVQTRVVRNHARTHTHTQTHTHTRARTPTQQEVEERGQRMAKPKEKEKVYSSKSLHGDCT